MDFNTGSGGSGGSSGPPRVSGGASGGEFDYSDPVQSFINAVRGVVPRPVDFFRGIRREGDFVNPLIFAIICYEVSAILSGLLASCGGIRWSRVRFFPRVPDSRPDLRRHRPVHRGRHTAPARDADRRLAQLGLEGTFRVGAYSSVTSLVSWIPVIGWIASLYGIYLAIMGIREVHNTSTGKAALVVLIPAVVVFLLVLLIVAAIGAAIFFGTQQ